MTGLRLAAIALPGESEPWSRLGFAVDGDGRIRLGNGALSFGAGASALVVERDDALLGDVPGDLPDDVDGVLIRSGEVADGIDQPNGAFEIDHVVVMTDSLERTSAAIEEGLGLEQRRVRETPTVRQGFHRFDDQGVVRGCIIEVVENPRVEQPALWGLVVNVRDLDEFVSTAGDQVGEPKPAVQPGRRIVTVRGSAGLAIPVAVMSSERA